MKCDADVRQADGKTFVTMNEFSRRMGCSRNTVKDRVARGVLETRTFDRRRTRYIDWEYGQRVWALSPPDSTKAKAGNVSANHRYKKPISNVISTPKVKPIEIDDLSAEMPEPMGLEDLSSVNFDRERYGDCYDKGVINYDRLKMRLTSETYKLKYDKERGLLVSKSEVLTVLTELAAVVRTICASVPQRYTDTFIAVAERTVRQRTGDPSFEFFEADKKALRVALENVPVEIMNDIKRKVKEFSDD